MNKTLITHPNFQELGKKIAEERGMNFPQVDFKSFPDEWPNLFVHRVKECIEHQDVTYI